MRYCAHVPHLNAQDHFGSFFPHEGLCHFIYHKKENLIIINICHRLISTFTNNALIYIYIYISFLIFGEDYFR